MHPSGTLLTPSACLTGVDRSSATCPVDFGGRPGSAYSLICADWRLPGGRADIPGFFLSSSGRDVVSPGGGFVVEGVRFEAAVQDPDESVGELT
jgi:hypothetical protein